jgi:CRP-like cAMP-binding protein
MGGFVTMPSSNRLLRLLDGEAFDSLSPVAVQLRAREVLCEPGMPALHVYFPISAVVSIVSTMESGASAEVAVVGREGMVGLGGISNGHARRAVAGSHPTCWATSSNASSGVEIR